MTDTLEQRRSSKAYALGAAHGALYAENRRLESALSVKDTRIRELEAEVRRLRNILNEDAERDDAK